MIALISGEVVARRADYVVVDTGGVGYRLAVSSQTLSHVPSVGEQCALHTHLIMRDDAMQLYGFASEDERALFLALLGVQAVGPKVALAVLSGGSSRELVAALAAGDTDRFKAVPGIGPKTAQRIVIELRDKITDFDAGAPEPQLGAVAASEPKLVARDGLIGLGYTLLEAESLLREAEGASAEELIESALKAARAGTK